MVATATKNLTMITSTHNFLDIIVFKTKSSSFSVAWNKQT